MRRRDDQGLRLHRPRVHGAQPAGGAAQPPLGRVRAAPDGAAPPAASILVGLCPYYRCHEQLCFPLILGIENVKNRVSLVPGRVDSEPDVPLFLRGLLCFGQHSRLVGCPNGHTPALPGVPTCLLLGGNGRFDCGGARRGMPEGSRREAGGVICSPYTAVVWARAVKRTRGGVGRGVVAVLPFPWGWPVPRPLRDVFASWRLCCTCYVVLGPCYPYPLLCSSDRSETKKE